MTKAKQKTVIKDYLYLLTLEAQKMTKYKVDLQTLRRKISPYCKTTKTGDIYTLTLKGTKFSVLLYVVGKNGDTTEISAVSSKHQAKYSFTIHADSNKELLQKLIHKFNFFN